MMESLGSLWIWREPDLAGKMPWYRGVADNRRPAKYLIAAHIPVSLDLQEATEEELWQELDDKTPRFLALWQRVRDGHPLPQDGAPSPNLRELCREVTQRMLGHCNFCRWECEVDRRQASKYGTCKLASDTRVSTYFHHRGEELIFRGRQGSGTIFFTSCNMRCAFCQNGDISTDKDNGAVVSPRELATMAWLLRAEGCHNVNWVGGEVTIHLHTIIAAIDLLADLSPSRADLRRISPMKADRFPGRFARAENEALYNGSFNAPMLWNSNFFMSQPSMKVLRLLMDVWLPDLKFGPGRCAVKLSRTPWYWETVTGNIRQIYEWGEDLAIRHLVMPNHVDCCTRPILEWIAETMPDVPLNIMDQYHPDNYCAPWSGKYDEKYAEIARRPTSREIRSAYRYAAELGLRFEAISYEKNSRALRA